MTMITAELFRPAREAFTSGTLLMPQDILASAVQTVSGWGDTGINGYLIALSAFVMIIDIRGLYYILPDLTKCYTHWRWNITAENSMQFCRERDLFALLAILPLTVTASRFDLILPGSFVPGPWHTALVFGIIIGYIVLRKLLYLFLCRRARRVSTWQAAHATDVNIFILYGIISSITAALLWLVGINDLIIRDALWIEAGLAFLMLLWHKNHILGTSCNPFATFLYLCSLDFLPTGLLITLVAMI